MKVIVLNLHGARVDAFGAYGSSWVTTPHFDRLAAEGVVFDQHYAEEIEYSSEEGKRLQLVRTDSLDRALLGILGNLRTNQVPTACFRDARLGRGLESGGWKEYVEVQAADLPALEQPTITDGVFQLAIDWVQLYGTQYTDWLLMVDIGALVPPWNDREQLHHEGNPDSTDESDTTLPQFEYVELGDAEPPKDRFGWKKAYAGAMQYVDDLVGQFLNLLKELALDQECLISITSFQGQSLGERSGVPARDLGLHEEIVHLPLLLRLPGFQGAGRRIHHLTQFKNWVALLTECFDLKYCWPGDPARYSLLPLARGEGRRLNEYLVIQADPLEVELDGGEYRPVSPRELAVRTPDWYFLLPRFGWQRRPAQLYRKPEDRWDMNNVIKEHPEVADHLELSWYRHRHYWSESRGKGEPPSLRDDVVKVVKT